MKTILPLLALALGLAAGAFPARAQANLELPRGRPRRVPPSLLMVRVVDEKGAPMQGAYVTVGGMDHGASTDRDGKAKLTVEPGGRLVVVSRQGYAFQRRPADFVSGDTVRQEVAMTPAPVELEGITVTTWGRSMNLVRNGFYDRQRRGLGAFMTRQRLDEVRPFRTTDAFRYMRGFMVRPMGMQDVVTSNRGAVSLRGGSCIPSVYIDGMRMFIREPRDQVDALNMVWPDDIEAIEAYQGPASIPAEYNPMGTACGVILIWTRR